MRPTVLALLLLALGSNADGQSVRGTVTDSSGAPIGDARIFLIGGGPDDPPHATRSDSLGRFIVHGARPGSYRVSVSRIGFGPVTSGLVDLDIAGVVTVNITLRPRAVPLAPVKVVERGRLSFDELMSATGFDLRMTRGNGLFMDSTQLNQFKLESGSEVMRSYLKSAVWFSDSGPGLAVRSGLGICQTTVFLDGHQIPAGSADATFETLAARDIYGVEVYRKRQAPPASLGGFLTPVTDTGCVLAVWTKARAAKRSR